MIAFIVRVGVPPKLMEISAMPLLMKRAVITGSLIGGMKETQEVLDFCGKHNITSDIENIPATPDSIKKAYERTLKADVKYRFVLDILHDFEWLHRLPGPHRKKSSRKRPASYSHFLISHPSHTIITCASLSSREVTWRMVFIFSASMIEQLWAVVSFDVDFEPLS